ncbi:hypothetical protein HDV00_006054 [Rhizophlyctis rosea]|nr:hypothetical protein HDV00_006054 [Rhizophlyctis rosea]
MGLMQMSLSSLSAELRSKIYHEFLYSAGTPTHYLPFRASCKEFHTHLHIHLTTNHLPNFCIELTLYSDLANMSHPDPESPLCPAALRQYVLPKLARHWTRCKTEEEQLDAYEDALQMIERGGHYLEDSIEDILEDEDLSMWSPVFCDDDYNIGNREIVYAMFGEWVEMDLCAHHEGDWGPMRWLLHSHVDGKRGIFKCSDNVTPFIVGRRWVTVEVKGRMVDMKPRTSIVESEDEDEKGNAEDFSGRRTWQTMGADGDTIDYSIEVQDDEDDTEAEEDPEQEHERDEDDADDEEDEMEGSYRQRKKNQKDILCPL